MAAHSFTTHISSFIRAQNLIHPGDLIVAAISGGPDSLAMLHALVTLRATLGHSIHVVHLDHLLRGAESAAEAQFVAQIAEQWGLPATIEAHDVAILARTQRLNVYAAGRAARYQFFGRVAIALGAQAVAVAHTANDQAETLLMHLLRGAGSAGLSGMQPLVAWHQWQTYAAAVFGAAAGAGQYAPALIRPLLTTTRPAIEAYCREQGLPARYDPANEDTTHTRSRIRHDLLPQLIEYNPRIIEALCRTADTLAAEHDLVEQALDACWPQLARLRLAGIDLDRGVWRELHPALQRAALRRAYAALGGQATVGLADLERAMVGAAAGVGRVIELPGGLALTVGYQALTIGEVQASGPQLLGEIELLTIPGELALQHGWRALAGVQQPGAAAGPWSIQIAQAEITEPLALRRRRPGDRIVGRRGSRSIQDVMVDAKLPRGLRDAWPILVAGERILWVAGVRVAEGIQAERGALVVQIKIQKPEQSSAEE